MVGPPAGAGAAGRLAARGRSDVPAPGQHPALAGARPHRAGGRPGRRAHQRLLRHADRQQGAPALAGPVRAHRHRPGSPLPSPVRQRRGDGAVLRRQDHPRHGDEGQRHPGARAARLPHRVELLLPARLQQVLRAAQRQRPRRQAHPPVAAGGRRGPAPGDAVPGRPRLAAQPGGAPVDPPGRRGAGPAPPGAGLRRHQQRGDPGADPRQAGAAAAQAAGGADGGGAQEVRGRPGTRLPVRPRGVFGAGRAARRRAGCEVPGR